MSLAFGKEFIRPHAQGLRFLPVRIAVDLQPIVGAEEDQRRWGLFVEVHRGRDLAGELPVAAEANGHAVIVEAEHGIEQHHCLGNRGDREVIVRSVDALGDHGTRRQMPTGRPARGNQPPRIDTQPAGVLADPADGAAGVLHAFVGCNLVAALDAIIGAGRHQAAAGEVRRLGFKLPDRPAGPTTSEEEDDCGTTVGRFPVGGIVEMNLEFSFADGFEYVLALGRLAARLSRR